jgi:hypothetical protein
MTGNPEVIGSSVGLVLTNALGLTGLANFRVAGKPEVMVRSGIGITSAYPVTQEEARRGLLLLYDSISCGGRGFGLGQAEMSIASMLDRLGQPDWNGLE